MKRDLNALTNREYDVVIIGAGIYGVTVAWDAVLRGLSVAIIDKGDFGGATSSNSLKIIHGGLRYLQHLDIKRMRESVQERMILMRIAPHLVHPFPCLMPTYGHLMKGSEIMRIGMFMNDIISFDRNLLNDPGKRIPMGRVVSKSECLHLVPGIDGRRVSGGAIWYDAQMINSERLLLSFVISANQYGAQIANYVQAVGFLKRSRRIEGIRAKDLVTGSSLEIRAKVVVNTSGGWIDEVLGFVDEFAKKVNLSTAMNLVINRQLLPEYAAGISSRFEFERMDGTLYKGSRVLFLAPWRHYTLLGTYHKPYKSDPDQLKVTEEEIEIFLRELNNAYPGAPISREEISFFHKGFLPMDEVDRKTGEVRLTKHYHIYDHKREDNIDGLVSVVGVKYTTARDVSERTVDLVFNKLGKKRTKSVSDITSLIGGKIEIFDDFMSKAISEQSNNLSVEVIKHLVYNYGSEYKRIIKYIEKRPDLKKTVPDSSEVLRAEVLHSVREEMAQKLMDVVLRRTELGSGGNPGDAALNVCAEMMAEELGWDKTKMKEEIQEAKKVYIPEK